MTSRDVRFAKDKDLAAALPALQRAGVSARKKAERLGSSIVVVRDRRIVRISPARSGELKTTK
jgi:hypothetical protein